jgi:hypothetical protein
MSFAVYNINLNSLERIRRNNNRSVSLENLNITHKEPRELDTERLNNIIFMISNNLTSEFLQLLKNSLENTEKLSEEQKKYFYSGYDCYTCLYIILGPFQLHNK